MSNEVKSGILEKKGQKYFPVTDVSLVQGLQDLLSGKQEALVSGENIKTINGESILGSGDIESASAYYLQGTINLTSTPPTATITSGSYAEAVEAYNAGSSVYIAMEESNEIVNVYPLAIAANGFLAFSGLGDDSFIVIVVPSTNSPEVVKAGIVHPEDISQFITNSVNNLVNYYTKTETYTKTEVAQLIANTLAGSFVSVNVLSPTPTADNLGKIYLVPSDVPDENNIKNEFIVEERNGSYYWEQIGSTALSLDGYATTEDLGEAIDNVPFAEGAGTDSAEQWNCSASGNYSVASGYNTTAKGQASHSEGYDTNAAEQNSHAEGYHTTANGANAHIEGRSQNKPTDATIAKNNDDLITDWNTKRFALAKGNASHVEGYNNLGLGNYSHAEGAGTIALGAQSHAEGNFTQTTNANEHAEGQWNQSNTGTIHSIGIGANANTRKNAFEVMSNGDAYLYGVGGYDGTNPSGSESVSVAMIQGEIVQEISPAEQYVSQELMNLLAIAPTMKVTWERTSSVINKKIFVNHPLMNYENAEIVLLSYSKKNRSRSVPRRYNKKYCIATPWKNPGNYFTFSSETDFNDFATFMSSFRGWSDGAWTMPTRTRHFGIALRIPNPAYNGPATPNKNNTYHGVPESIWSTVLRVGISYDSDNDKWGIGIK